MNFGGRSPQVGAKYTQTATSISGSAATIVWTNTVFERGGGTMSTGIYTVGPSGIYHVNASIRIAASSWALNDTINMQVTVDGTGMLLHLPRSFNTQSDMTAMCNGLLNLTSSQLVRVVVAASGQSPSVPNNAGDTYFSIVKVA